MIDVETLPQVAVDEMNTIHKKEVEIINTLFEFLDTNASAEAISQQCQILIEHMQSHFAYEEARMRETGFPLLTMHQAEHNKVLQEMRYVYMHWRNRKDNDALKEHLQEELPSWLDQHIKAMDTPAAEFFASKL